jgi:hypothetical protein
MFDWTAKGNRKAEMPEETVYLLSGFLTIVPRTKFSLQRNGVCGKWKKENFFGNRWSGWF